MGEPLVRYLPGRWTFLAHADAWLLIDVPLDDGVVTRLWDSLGERPNARAVLDLLLESYTPFDLPGFAFAARRDAGAEVAVRHPAGVRSGTTSLSPDDSSPWVTTAVIGRDLTLSSSGALEDARAPTLPLGTGSVLAAMVLVELASTPLPPDEHLSSQDAQAALSASETSDPSPTSGEFARLLQGAPPLEPPAPPPAPRLAPAPAADVLPEPQPEPELAALPESAKGEHTLVWDARGTAATPTPESPEPAELDRSPSPSADEHVAEPAPPLSDHAAQPVLGDPIEHAATVDPSPETVLAARCPVGHWTPAFAPDCRVCGEPIPAQAPVDIPRPNLGVLRLANGDSIDLDRGAILGRAPTVLDGGAERPNLINLATFGHDISRVHAEIVLDGWNVLVRDLGSTNGTTIVLPGRVPERLVAQDLHALEPGTTIEIGEVTTIRFESTKGS